MRNCLCEIRQRARGQLSLLYIKSGASSNGLTGHQGETRLIREQNLDTTARQQELLKVTIELPILKYSELSLTLWDDLGIIIFCPRAGKQQDHQLQVQARLQDQEAY